MPLDDDALVPVGDADSPGSLRRFFFREASAVEAPGDVVSWWEHRRVPYNLAVGTTGVVTLAASNLLNGIGPHASTFLPPWQIVVAYGVLANILYTGGWLTELALRPVFGRKTPVVGATIFRYGFAFSIGLTLLPNVIATLSLIARLLSVVPR